MPNDPNPPPPPKARTKPPTKERRAPRGGPVTTNWLKQLIGRPLTLEGRGVQLRVAMAERRRPPEVIEAEAVEYLRGQLVARMGAAENRRAAKVMRQLRQVHDVLGTDGWAGVNLLPSAVLGKARVQAQMLLGATPSSTVTAFIERLRLLQGASSVREERHHQSSAHPRGSSVEVSEVSHEEFEAMTRQGADSEPPPDRPPDGQS